MQWSHALHLDAFVEAYQPGKPLSARVETERFKRWGYDDLKDRPGFNLDLWADVVDQSIDDPSLLPAPEVIAEEILEQLSSALEEFKLLTATLAVQRTGATPDVDADPAAALAN